MEVVEQAKTQRVTLRSDEVRLFCKESYNLRLIRGTPLYEELESSPSNILLDLGKYFTHSSTFHSSASIHP